MTEGAECSIMIAIGPTIVTSFTSNVPSPYGPARVRIPFPEGAWFTLPALAAIFNVTLNHMYLILHRHKANLGVPVYRVRTRGSRRPRHRILSQQDYDYLRTLFPVIVGLRRTDGRRK